MVLKFCFICLKSSGDGQEVHCHNGDLNFREFFCSLTKRGASTSFMDSNVTFLTVRINFQKPVNLSIPQLKSL